MIGRTTLALMIVLLHFYGSSSRQPRKGAAVDYSPDIVEMMKDYPAIKNSPPADGTAHSQQSQKKSTAKFRDFEFAEVETTPDEVSPMVEPPLSEDTRGWSLYEATVAMFMLAMLVLCFIINRVVRINRPAQE